jgi:hypothetical protein
MAGKWLCSLKLSHIFLVVKYFILVLNKDTQNMMYSDALATNWNIVSYRGDKEDRNYSLQIGNKVICSPVI